MKFSQVATPCQDNLSQQGSPKCLQNVDLNSQSSSDQLKQQSQQQSHISLFNKHLQETQEQQPLNMQYQFPSLMPPQDFQPNKSGQESPKDLALKSVGKSEPKPRKSRTKQQTTEENGSKKKQQSTKVFEEDKLLAENFDDIQLTKQQTVGQEPLPPFIKLSGGLSHKTGRWTKDEHFRFLEALKIHGKEWKKVQEHVCTRTSTQARSHAQKFFNKLEKRKQSLADFLDELDLNNLENHYIMSDLEDENPIPDLGLKKSKTLQKQSKKSFSMVTIDSDLAQKQAISCNNMIDQLKSIDIDPNNGFKQQEVETPRQTRKRRAGGTPINYALFDKTGCQNEKESPDVKSPEDRQMSNKSMSRSSSSHRFNPQDEPVKKNSMLKKRPLPIQSCQTLEFQPPLPKGDNLCRSNSKQVKKFPSMKVQKVKDSDIPKQLFQNSEQQAPVDQVASNSIITQASGESYQTHQEQYARQQAGYMARVEQERDFNLVYNNQQMPMTPDLRRNNSMFNGNLNNSMVGDQDFQLSVISQNSGSRDQYRKNKKQRANSYEDFGGGILDHDGDSAYEEDEMDHGCNLMEHAPGQVPSGLIPPTNLQLGQLAFNMQMGKSEIQDRMITPKQQYSVFNLLPPSSILGGNDGFDGLDRMRRSFNMQRRNSHDQTGEEVTNPRVSLTPNLNFDQYNGLSMHGNILPLPDLNQGLFVGQKNFMNMQINPSMQGYGKFQGYMNDAREDLEGNQLFQSLGQSGEEHKDQ